MSLFEPMTREGRARIIFISCQDENPARGAHQILDRREIEVPKTPLRAVDAIRDYLGVCSIPTGTTHFMLWVHGVSFVSAKAEGSVTITDRLPKMISACDLEEALKLRNRLREIEVFKSGFCDKDEFVGSGWRGHVTFVFGAYEMTALTDDGPTRTNLIACIESEEKRLRAQLAELGVAMPEKPEK